MLLTAMCRGNDFSVETGSKRLVATNGTASGSVRKTNSLSFGGERIDFTAHGKQGAFIILPKGDVIRADKRPWIWYAPTFIQNGLPGRELDWLFLRLLQAGYAIGGVDVGESYGNPVEREIFDEFHAKVVRRFSLSPKASLLAQSRGGLMLYNWAAEHPEKVKCIGGIYTVCNLSSYPGLDKAAPAYGMTRDELFTQLKRHNPIDRLTPLAEAKIPIFHIHGDADKLVPLEVNSGELIRRYREMGGDGQLTVVPGKGHEVCPEFFQSQALLKFFLTHRDNVVELK